MRRDILIGGAIVLAVGLIGLRFVGNHVASTSVDAALAHLPPGYSATHGAVSVDPASGASHVDKLVLLRNGQPLFSADDVTLTGLGAPDADGVPARLGHLTAHGAAFLTYRHIDRIELDGVALHNLRALIDPHSYPNGKPASADRMDLLASSDVFGATMHVEPPPPKNGGPIVAPFDVTVQHAHAEGIRSRLFAAPPTPEALQDPAFVTDLARAVAETSASVEGINAQLPQGSFTLGSETVQGYDAGRVQRASLEAIGWVGTTVPGSVSLQKFEVKNLDMTRLLDRLPALIANPQKAGTQLNDSVRFDSVDLRGFKADIPAAPLVTLESISGTNSYGTGGIITTTGEMKGLAIVTTGRAIKPTAQQALQQFGMADFAIDGSGRSRLDPSTGRVTGDGGQMTFRDLGTLHITYDLDGVPLSQQDPAQVADAFRNTKLIAAEMRWDDASLTGRLFKVAAAQTGKSEQELRATISLSLLGLIAMLPDQPDAADQVNAFLDGRHSLEITLAPPAPVRLGDLEAVPLPQKAHVLGVRITGS
jgi:hypothetical protein